MSPAFSFGAAWASTHGHLLRIFCAPSKTFSRTARRRPTPDLHGPGTTAALGHAIAERARES